MTAASPRQLAQELAAVLLGHANLTIARFNKFASHKLDNATIHEVLSLAAPTEQIFTELIAELSRQGSLEAVMGCMEWWDQNHANSSLQVYRAAAAACSTHFAADAALNLLQRMQSASVPPDLSTANLVITACAQQGRMEDVQYVLAYMSACGLQPNSYTALTVMQCAKFKRRGLWREALQAMDDLGKQGGEVPEIAEQLLLDVCEAAVEKACSLEAAWEVVKSLRRRDLHRSRRVYAALLRACARHRSHTHAMEAFQDMEAVGVPATSAAYNALIEACVRAGELPAALEAFEWLAAGRGLKSDGMVGQDARPYNALIRACHTAGMLEKALEVMAWMEGAGLGCDPQTYDELIATVEVAGLWDDKALRAARRAGTLAVTPDQLRPSAFDGMRMLYLDHGLENFVEEVLAQQKLGISSWAPPAMRPVGAAHAVMGPTERLGTGWGIRPEASIASMISISGHLPVGKRNSSSSMSRSLPRSTPRLDPLRLSARSTLSPQRGTRRGRHGDGSGMLPGQESSEELHAPPAANFHVLLQQHIKNATLTATL